MQPVPGWTQKRNNKLDTIPYWFLKQKKLDFIIFSLQYDETNGPLTISK